MVLWRIATRGLGVFSTLILAHVLVPQDFGVVAIATTYLAAFEALSSVGLQDAVIRASDAGEELHDTAFTLAVLRGAINGTIVALSAPIAARFFSEPRIEPVLYVLAGLALVEGFENIGTVEFRRDLRFNKEFQLFLLPRLISVAVTIGAALTFKSFWALVMGIAVLRLARLGFSYAMHPYRPRLSIAAWRRIAGFSFWTWASSIASFGRDRSWAIIVGRFFDPASVGSFTMASEIGLLPVSELVYPICRALFSGFSVARSQGSSLGPAFVRTIGVVAIPILPAAIGISAVGNYVVTLALGPEWAGTIPIMQIVAASAPLMLLTAIGGTVMNAAGNVRNIFWIVAISACLGAGACVWMAEHFGMIGVAVSTSLLMTIEGLLFLVVTARTVGASPREIISRLWRPLAATLVMSAVLWSSGYGWRAAVTTPTVAMTDCAIAVVLGAATYIASLCVLWKLSADPDPLELFLVATLRRSLDRRKADDAGS